MWFISLADRTVIEAATSHILIKPINGKYPKLQTIPVTEKRTQHKIIIIRFQTGFNGFLISLAPLP
jgi:hypothetical protein